MSEKAMTNEDKKEIKDKSQVIEAVTLDSKIPPEEVKQINDAITFLDSKKDIDDKKINENITEQKEKLKTDIQNQFSNTEVITNKEGNTEIETKIKTEEIQKIQDPEVVQAYINLIDWIKDDSLNTLKTAFERQKTSINQKITETNEATEKQKAEDILNSTIRPQELFDIKDKNDKGADFNLVMQYLCGADNTKIISSASTGYDKKLFDLVTTYKPGEEITEITIGKAKKPVGDSLGFAKQFTEGTWLIEYKIGTSTDKKYIGRGTNEQLEENKGEQAGREGKFDKNVFGADFDKKNKQGMEYFDKDMGYFAGFKIYLDIQEKANPGYVKQYLPKIMAEINTIQPEENKEFVKNGYANVLTDYVIAHPELTGIYFDNFNPNDLNLLGANETTRTNNYNRLLFSDIKNDVLRPEIQNYITSLTPEGKQQFLSKIGNIKEAITGKGKMSTTETLQQGFDKLIDQFGPILFNVLKFFGMNKTSLLKRFPNSEARINEEFQKEYGLGEDKKTAVDTIANTIGGNTKFDRDYEKKGDPTAKDLKENFTKTNDYKDIYITELIKNDKSEKGTNNLQYLNLSVFDTAVKTYNKKAEQKVNILDIVDIETKKIDGKEMKSINKIKDGQEDIFKKIMAAYLDSDTPWINVANSNKQITTETTYKEGEIAKLAGKNEQGIDINQAKDYRITTQQQLVKYLTASLFSNKDLSYVMTENGLKGEHVDKNINNESKNTKLDIQQKYIADDGTLKNVEPVTINDIFTEFDKAPDNLMFTKKGETVGKEVRKGEINGKKTYVYTADMTKVTIHDGDKIEAIPLTATTTVVENKPSEEKA